MRVEISCSGASAAALLPPQITCERSFTRVELVGMLCVRRAAQLRPATIGLQDASDEEGKRMASGFIGNEVPRKGLRVRVPCPPLLAV